MSDGTALERRPLGGTGLTASALGMGCARLGAFWQGRGFEDARRAVGSAREAGIDFFDTADCYARGLSERLLGRALVRERDEVVLCTKVGLLKTPAAARRAQRCDQTAPSGPGALARAVVSDPPSTCFHPAYVRRALERSLRRLATDHVDLLLLHGPSLGIIQEAAFLPALERAKREGQVRHFGISCATTATAQAALVTPGLAALQVPHNLCRPELVANVADRAIEAGVAVVATSPFGDGRLLGATSGRDPVPGERTGGFLHFALGTPGVAVVLVGMSRPGHVHANVEAALAPPPAAAGLEELRRRLCRPGSTG